MTRILVINGHPDAAPHFLHAAADAYASGALEAGHEVRRIDIGKLDFPILRCERQWQVEAPVPDIAAAQLDILWAEHLAILYPLWLGETPALFKAFLEQVARPDFAFEPGGGGFPKGRLKGRSARMIVTMGMPAPLYTLYYRAHGVKSFKRNILQFVAIDPVRYAVIGSVEGPPAHREKWLDRLRRWGQQSA